MTCIELIHDMYRVKSPVFDPNLGNLIFWKEFSLPSRYSITIFSCQLLIIHYQLSIVNYQLSLRPPKSWLEPNRALALAKRGNGSSHFGHTLKRTKNIT